MTFYFTLSFSTLLIVFFQYLIWKKKPNILFPVATLFLYYWSIFGGWFIVYDQLNNNASSKIGVHYYDYFEKLFPIELNNDYLLSIVYFALFIVAFQVIILFLLDKDKKIIPPSNKIVIHHRKLILVSAVCLILSFLFIYRQMLDAAQQHQSLYIFISHNNGSFYSLYQLFKGCSLLTAFSGLVIYLNSDRAIFLSGTKLRFGIIYYLLLMLVIIFYSLILGSRHELVFSGMFCLILYVINGTKVNVKDLCIIFIILVLPVFLIELTRGIPILDYIGIKAENAPIEETKTGLSGKQAFTSIFFSNEIFSGHMSMYGAIHRHLPLTYGSSFLNLIASLVPRFIMPDRPMDIYHHYIVIANNPGVQGFTINHATGWYLNFGIVGIVAGGVLLGYLLSRISNNFTRTKKQYNSFMLCLKVLALPGIISSIPILVRSGPEGYKTLLFEGILIPVLIFWVSQKDFFFPSNSRQKKS